MVDQAILNNISLESAEDNLVELVNPLLLSEAELRNEIISGCERFIDGKLEAGEIADEEVVQLIEYIDHFGIDKYEELNRSGAFRRYAQLVTLQDLRNGAESRIKSDEKIPFNLQPTEKLLWMNTDAIYYKEKTRREYIGGSQGFSVRIAKGFWYRASAFRGKPIETFSMETLDIGDFGVTNKHLYFCGLPQSIPHPIPKNRSIQAL